MADGETSRLKRLTSSELVRPDAESTVNTTFRSIQDVQFVGFAELNLFELDPASAQYLDLAWCRENMVVILGSVPESKRELVYLGMLRPNAKETARAVEARIERRVVPVQLNEWEIRRALSRIYNERLPRGEDDPTLELGSDRRIRFDLEQSPSDMLDDLLSEAVRLGASDVHVEVFRDDVDLRFRVDGVMEQMTTPLSPANVHRVVSRIKVLAGLDIAEKRVPQDGRIMAVYLDDNRMRRVQLRVATIPGLSGEECVMRILDPGQVLQSLNFIGMQADARAGFEKLIRRPYGLVLVSGPTGSGKSTTLYCTLKEIHSPAVKILTAEDPVEYEFAKVSQKEVSEQVPFAAYVRSFLRQNPDILLIGEVRDTETAAECVKAANTGHLVLSTLHTNDAPSAVSRLRALGVRDDYIADVLIGVVAQRLVRKLCAQCRREEPPNPELLHKFFREKPQTPFFGPQGCEACDARGYKGRVGVFEVFRVTRTLARLVAQGKPVTELLEAAAEAGYRPMVYDALDKVASGITSLDEVARVVGPLYE